MCVLFANRTERSRSADNTEKINERGKNAHSSANTPPGRRPRAWPAWPAAGQTQPTRRWGSWWWSAERAPATPPHTPAHCRTPHRRSGAPAAPRRSCTEERSLTKSWCSWRMSLRKRRRWGSVKGHRWQRQRNYAQGRREGRKEGRSHLTCWAKSWSRSSGHGQAENQNKKLMILGPFLTALH